MLQFLINKLDRRHQLQRDIHHLYYVQNDTNDDTNFTINIEYCT